MLDCFLIHLRMETARMEEGKKQKNASRKKLKWKEMDME